MNKVIYTDGKEARIRFATFNRGKDILFKPQGAECYYLWKDSMFGMYEEYYAGYPDSRLASSQKNMIRLPLTHNRFFRCLSNSSYPSVVDSSIWVRTAEIERIELDINDLQAAVDMESGVVL